MGDEKQSQKLRNLMQELAKVPRIHLKDLKAGDGLKINTKTALFSFRIVDPPSCAVRITVASDDPEAANQLTGFATFIGLEILQLNTRNKLAKNLTIMKNVLMVGFPMVICKGDQILELPAAQEVWLNGNKVLPDLSRVPKTEK